VLRTAELDVGNGTDAATDQVDEQCRAATRGQPVVRVLVELPVPLDVSLLGGGGPKDGVAYVKARQDGGLLIGRSNTRIVLDADEAAQLIELAQELTKPTSPRATTPAKARLMVYPRLGPEGAPR
jgi:hypothetical protein